MKAPHILSLMKESFLFIGKNSKGKTKNDLYVILTLPLGFLIRNIIFFRRILSYQQGTAICDPKAMHNKICGSMYSSKFVHIMRFSFPGCYMTGVRHKASSCNYPNSWID